MIVYWNNPVVIAHASCVGAGVPEIQHSRRDILGVVTPRPVSLVGPAPGNLYEKVTGCQGTLGAEAPASLAGNPVIPEEDFGFPVEHEVQAVRDIIVTDVPDWRNRLAVLVQGKLLGQDKNQVRQILAELLYQEAVPSLKNQLGIK